jgi:hypothetical protein
MTIAMLVGKLKQFCLWFFWDMTWPKEKIITLGVLILVLMILSAVVKHFKKVSPAGKTTAVPTGQRRHWRTG